LAPNFIWLQISRQGTGSRRRTTPLKGYGIWDNDRPPVAGVVGRESGEIRLEVCQHRDRETLQPFVEERTRDTAPVYADEWQAYNHLPESGRAHASV
jgi:transposase